MLISSTIPNESTVILQTSKSPSYYTIIGSVVYYHRVFYGTAYTSDNSKYRLFGKIDQESKEYSYKVVDDRYTITYENKVITTDVNGYYHIRTEEGNVINVIPVSQVDGNDVVFDIIRGKNNINYIRFRNPSTNEYYGAGKTCTARFYKLVFDAFS